ncbi:MAG: hypothetical protein AAF705_13335 [Bacteroidota bacterium]
MQTNKKQTALLLLLGLQFLGVLLYTLYVGTQDGWIFIQEAIDNIGGLNWDGQFTLDFACYLILSGLWIMWRGHFKAPALILAMLAIILGIIVFVPYLIYLIVKEKGDLKSVLLGAR